jgi:hypothetical protein
MDGTCEAVMTIRESPSKVKFLSCKEATRETAKRVARASPKLGSRMDDLRSFDDGPCVIPANCCLS